MISLDLPSEVSRLFQPIEFIDNGSQGSVWKVTKKSSVNLGNGKVYAMKILKNETLDPNITYNVENELKLLKKIKSPYITHLHSYVWFSNQVYIIMDYCPNHDLLKVISDAKKENKALEEDEIWKYAIQICLGLESLHSRNFIHRDINAKNILLDVDRNAKIADFGLSRHSLASSVAGLPYVYSPRSSSRCRKDAQTQESDIWAFGCVLYGLCNFNYPFDSNEEDIKYETHTPIRSQYSNELKSLVDWCLKKERHDRPKIFNILTDEFIVRKAISLGILIPDDSCLRRNQIYVENMPQIPLNLQLKSELSECSNEIANQNSEIKQLKAEIANLKSIIASKGNDIETLRLKAVEISKILEKRKRLNEKRLFKVKNSIRNLIADADKIKKMLDYSDQDLNVKEAEIAQIEIITAQNLMDKRSKILKRSNNTAELENEFRRTYSLYQNHSTAHDELTQAYQDYLTTYHQKTSLFNIYRGDSRTCNLLIYNTETETEESKVLQTPLDRATCVTQLPNGKLFCFGKYYNTSGVAWLIDVNNDCRVEELPSGTACHLSSAIYFNNNVYCFGGLHYGNSLTLSSRFDLYRNKWNELAPLPKADYSCNSVIFNGSILISGRDNKNLLRYLIDNNSFTTIPYDFAEKKTKVLINAERLYLIECENGSIYESEVGSDSAWRWIADSTIDFLPWKTYCQYNKGGIYIGLIHYVSSEKRKHVCFKFNLNERRLDKLVENNLSLNKVI